MKLSLEVEEINTLAFGKMLFYFMICLVLLSPSAVSDQVL